MGSSSKFPARAAAETDLGFLSGDGEMATLMRAHDWAATPLGAPATWPQALRTMVRLILNTGHPMYIFWGLDLICFYNEAYRQSIGPERHPGSLGRPAREVWDEIWPIIGPQIAQVMSGGGATWHVNALVPITRHGRREDVYWTYSYSPIDDPTALDGVGGVLVVCTETTATVLAERRHAEEVLRQHRLAAVVESSEDAILTKDLDGVITSWNRGAQRLFGYTAAEMIGRSVTVLIPPERMDEEPTVLARIRDGKAIEAYETVRCRKDGTLIDISLSVSPLRDHRGVVIGASKIARDISALKRARDQERLLVREMHHRIKNLFALAGGIVSLSARDAETPAGLAKTVTQRLLALARAHDLTLSPEAELRAATLPPTLHALIKAIMAPYESLSPAAARVVLEGADIPVSPAAATTLALLLHEFATNAAKYGALSADAGSVDIRCALDAEMLHLIWTERGGPAVGAPAGGEWFGSYLVTATVRSLGGEIAREWTGAALVIRLSAKLRAILPAG